jgi:hypothetical protein
MLVVFNHVKARQHPHKSLSRFKLPFGPCNAIGRAEIPETGMRGTWFQLVMAVGLALAGLLSAHAQNPDDLKRGVVRISFLNGEVSIQRGDSGDWEAATVNAPLVTGDRISTAPNSRAEVQFDSGNILRAGGGAVVGFSQLEYGRYQMDLGLGTVTFRVIRPSNNEIEVDTPSVSVRPSKQGTYRITVSPAGDSEITARSGEVEVFTPRGSQWVSAGQTMMARGTSADPEIQITNAIPYDDWDRWNDGRDRPVLNSRSYQYVPPGVYGAEDLDPYGNWVNVQPYGYVWQPVVAAGWAPYRYGRWVWEDWYGWTWVSYEPWGWAPYHYGRWLYASPYGWVWYPGAIGVVHYWSPALVAFFGFGGGVGLGFGNVGWVPLAPYEVLFPWWGPGFYGRPEYFNRLVNVTNLNIVSAYRNARVTNGVTAVSAADFRGGRFSNFVHASPEDLRQASFARGPMPVAPERSDLRFSDRQASFVPRSTGVNRVFSYRQPNPAVRVPFGQAGGWQSNRGSAPSSVSPGLRNPTGGWERFGEPRSAPTAVSPSPQQAAPYTNRGWSRFGDPAFAGRPEYQIPARPPASNYQSNGGSRQQSLRIAPPVVRERPQSGGAYSAPQNRTQAPSGGSGVRAPRGSGGGGGHRGR